jgi:hypothetical protein
MTAPRRVITFQGEKTLQRLADAGLGKLTTAATPYGVLPGLEVSEAVWKSYQTWMELYDRNGIEIDLADYLFKRLERLR